MPKTAPLVPKTPYQKWLAQALDNARLDLAELARKIGRDYNYLWRVGNGDPKKYPNARRPGYELALQIGMALGDVSGSLEAANHPVPPGIGKTEGLPSNVSAAIDRVAELLTPLEIVNIPIVGPADAGHASIRPVRGDRIAQPIPVYSDDTFPILRTALGKLTPDEAFAFRVRGFCLEGVHILDGDMLICRKNPSPESGRIVVVDEAGEILAKRLRKNGVGSYLETVPAQGEPQRVTLNGETRIIGEMIALMRSG